MWPNALHTGDWPYRYDEPWGIYNVALLTSIPSKTSSEIVIGVGLDTCIIFNLIQSWKHRLSIKDIVLGIHIEFNMRLLKKQHSPSVSTPLGNMTDSKAPHPAKEYDGKRHRRRDKADKIFSESLHAGDLISDGKAPFSHIKWPSRRWGKVRVILRRQKLGRRALRHTLHGQVCRNEHYKKIDYKKLQEHKRYGNTGESYSACSVKQIKHQSRHSPRRDECQKRYDREFWDSDPVKSWKSRTERHIKPVAVPICSPL